MLRMMVIAATVSLVACGGDKDGSDTAAAAGTTAGVDGASVYADNCASCHGADGSGGVGTPLNAGVVAGLSDDELTSVITDGISPSMPSFALPTDELDALVAYLRSEFGS